MMKSISDPLVDIRNVLFKTNEKEISKMNCWDAISFNILKIRSIIELTPVIQSAQNKFEEDARMYTGGGDILASVRLSGNEDQRAFEVVRTSLANYHNALRLARASEEALILHSVDETQVPDPFNEAL